MSWCTRLARSLDADYTMQCESGNGLIMTDGATCTAVGGPATCMPQLWHYRLRCAQESAGNRGCPEVPGAKEALDVSESPHAVVINLGQNDYGAPAHIDPKTHKPVPSHLPTREQWTTHYEYFINNMTAAYKTEPTFFLVCGGMATKYCANTEAAVKAMNAKGQTNVHYVDVSQGGAGKNATTMGCGNHPSWISHEAMAHIARPRVQKIMGW